MDLLFVWLAVIVAGAYLLRRLYFRLKRAGAGSSCDCSTCPSGKKTHGKAGLNIGDLRKKI